MSSYNKTNEINSKNKHYLEMEFFNAIKKGEFFTILIFHINNTTKFAIRITQKENPARV